MRVVGKEVSDDSEDDTYVDPFVAYETARDIAFGEGPSGAPRSFEEESSHSDDDDIDDFGDVPEVESDAPTEVGQGDDAAARSEDSIHTGDTEIIPSSLENLQNEGGQIFLFCYLDCLFGHLAGSFGSFDQEVPTGQIYPILSYMDMLKYYALGCNDSYP
uniref:Uncharacterized protein n=1 Tax=Oryza punctata TaxID=4537 RepID=A0A0E0LBH6_ORYPU